VLRDGGLVARVHHVRGGSRTDLPGDRVEFGRGGAGQEHAGALTGVRPGDRPTDRAPAAVDHSNLVVQ
jgi:hypothetical protein